MDAKILYREGVTAIRDQQDVVRGRELLLQSLKEDPQNDMAWLWLTRTVKDRQKRLECVERALQINPQNEQAQQLKARLLAGATSPSAEASPQPLPKGTVIRPIGPKTIDVPLTPQENMQVAQLLQRADIYMESGDTEQAISQWVEVLKIQVDHELALRNAAGHLWKLNYWDDARELVQRAIDANTQVPAIYLTAIDMADRQGDHEKAEAIRERIATLPNADEQLLVTVADYYLKRYQSDQALNFLQEAVESHPDSQKLLLKTGDVLQEMDRKLEAMTYYDRAVRQGTRTKVGKEADKKLATFVPVLTDRERGSVWLAVRETAGIGIFYLLVGWQDAGLNLLDMGPRRWMGVLLSLVGGYLLITATSSPQQAPIAGWLGGQVPLLTNKPKREGQPGNFFSMPGRALDDPTNLPMISESVRWFLAMVGAAVLILAFWLVFYRALDVLTSGPLPYF
jgi:tetratricopeptide (TPR) repeat protein